MSVTGKSRKRSAAARETKAKSPTTTWSNKSASTKSSHKPTSGKHPKIRRSGDAASGPRSAGPYGVREASKLGVVIAMLHRKEGATIEGLSKATGWQAHSVRGALSGAIKKRLGLRVSSKKSDGVRTYRIAN